MFDLTWEAPPPPTSSGVDYSDIVEALRGHPGAWARIGDDLSYLDVRRMYRRFHALGVQTSRRAQPDGSYHLYVRWPES